jgi:predicted nucleotidyltransferase
MRLEKVMGSRSKMGILYALAGGKELQLSDMSRHSGMSISSLHDALKGLDAEGVLSVRKIGKTRLYRINGGNYFARIAENAIKAELKFGETVLSEFSLSVKPHGVLNVTVFGSFAKGEENPGDMDVLVVCKGGKSGLEGKIRDEEGGFLEKYGIHVSAMVLTEGELKEKAARNDRFIMNVIAEGRKLLGEDLEALAYGKGSK